MVEDNAMLVGAFHFPTDYGIDISELAACIDACGRYQGIESA